MRCLLIIIEQVGIVNAFENIAENICHASNQKLHKKLREHVAATIRAAELRKFTSLTP